MGMGMRKRMSRLRRVDVDGNVNVGYIRICALSWVSRKLACMEFLFFFSFFDGIYMHG